MSIDFSQVKTICVVGLTNNESRPAYGVASYMQKQGFRIIPVNPKGETVLGEQGYRSVGDIPRDIQIDVADYFIRSENVALLVAEALDRGIKIHWLQEGVSSQEASKLCREKGAMIIMDKCIKKEYKKHTGRGVSCDL